MRRVTFRTKHPKALLRELHPFIEFLSTITSPVFCEFVIELDKHPSYGDSPSLKWGRWGVVDRFLYDIFSHRENFRVTVRSHRGYDQQMVELEAIARFPMLFQRGYLHFETFTSIERFGS